MAPREVWASAFQAKEPTNRIAAAAVKATDSFRIASSWFSSSPLKPRTSEDVRFGSLADIAASSCDVRFTPNSGH